MRNRTVQDPEKSRMRPDNPFEGGVEEAFLHCSKCKKRLFYLSVYIDQQERVAGTRYPPILERAIHMHQCAGSLIERLIATNGTF